MRAPVKSHLSYYSVLTVVPFRECTFTTERAGTYGDIRLSQRACFVTIYSKETSCLTDSKAQAKYKKHHDKKPKLGTFKIGEWVLVNFLHKETGQMKKLSRSWYGLF